jgi:hypothetical protein
VEESGVRVGGDAKGHLGCSMGRAQRRGRGRDIP